MTFTILDFENNTSTTSLSRVPIQFIFSVWDSNITYPLPPIYIGDATLANIIGVYLSGFTQSSTYTDPYDSTINIFL